MIVVAICAVASVAFIWRELWNVGPAEAPYSDSSPVGRLAGSGEATPGIVTPVPPTHLPEVDGASNILTVDSMGWEITYPPCAGWTVDDIYDLHDEIHGLPTVVQVPA